MSDLIIQAENLSKLYRLGTLGTGSLRQDMTRWWQQTVLKKSDPFFDGTSEESSNSGHIWALKNISFVMTEGEVWGIVGHNGAGKSTLLKILSRIVKPTEGVVRGRGKISSLLEVGTGFHQELTGRENIFISGYMLGMQKSDIKKNFDEIVAFSGIGNFLDTPVKRYSSGMYVRLAFAVAAHLEPDILIVDEVLAVGDADFQKKCMGKMQEVSHTKGRTILFVSHNMQAVTNLCTTALWLNAGRMKNMGNARDVVASYIGNSKQFRTGQTWDEPETAPGNHFIRMKSIEVKPIGNEKNEMITVETPIQLDVEFWCLQEGFDMNINVRLLTNAGECIF